MSLLVVTAFSQEHEAVLHALDQDGADFFITGIGKESIQKNLVKFIEGRKISGALCAGFCGGLSHSAKIGALAVPDACVSSVKSFQPSLPLRQRISKLLYDNEIDFLVGDMVTSDTVVKTLEERKQLNTKTGALTVDMESAYFAEICEAKKIPWFVVKSVMDDLTTTKFSKEHLLEGLEVAKESMIKALRIIGPAARAEWGI